MPGRELDAVLIRQLRALADTYEQEHKEGGYTASTVRSRAGHAHRFVDYLEGRYDPRRDYQKRIAP